MIHLIPKAGGQKLEVADVECLLERVNLLDEGLKLSEDEKRVLLMILITKIGLRYLVEMLPSESKTVLRSLLCTQGVTSGTGVRRIRSRVKFPEITPSPRERKLKEETKYLLDMLNARKK